MSKLTSVKKEQVEREQLFQNPWNILKNLSTPCQFLASPTSSPPTTLVRTEPPVLKTKKEKLLGVCLTPPKPADSSASTKATWTKAVSKINTANAFRTKSFRSRC